MSAEVENEEQKENGNGDEEEDGNDVDNQSVPSKKKKVRQAIDILRRFLESMVNLEERLLVH